MRHTQRHTMAYFHRRRQTVIGRSQCFSGALIATHSPFLLNPYMFMVMNGFGLLFSFY